MVNGAMARGGALALVGLLAGCPPKQTAPTVEDPELARQLPFDPGVRTGTFDNGMQWFVERHTEPEQRAVLRLVVDVGSVVEDPDQLGLAHFVEHMAFNGTTHFPGNDVIHYLEGIGAQFGPHINAHTSFDETVYKLTVPTDDDEVFDKAFLVLEDWATGLTFDPAEVDKERPVVIEEWRTRLGAQGRIQDATVPAVYFGSPYAERLPIGTLESLQSFDVAAVKRFYADWYRPERMAVIAVGDFDVDAVVAKIQAHFGGIPKSTGSRERPVYEIPDHADTKYVIVADPEVTRTAVGVLAKLDRVEQRTVGAYRQALVEQLGFGMINERLSEIAQRPDAPFLGAGAGLQRLSPTEGAFVVSGVCKDGGAAAAYEAMLVEIERARRFGFTAGELDRAKARTTKQYEAMLLDRENSDSADEASELVRAFTNGEAVPGTEEEVALARKYVPEITLDELGAWAKTWMAETSRVVTVLVPKPAGDGPAAAAFAAPTEQELAAKVTAVAAMDLPAPAADGAVGDLIDPAKLPAPGTVVTRDTRYADPAGLGFTGWTLSNGVRVWFRDTDFKEDEVLMTAFSPGGTSLVADADVVSAGVMLDIVDRSGLGQLDATQVDRWLAGRNANVGWRISESFESLSGSASPSDLAPMLEMVWASIAEPRFTTDGFARALEQRRTALANRDADPRTQFEDAYTARVWAADPRRQPWTVATLDQADLGRAGAVYRERFGDAGDFTFVFAGNLPDDFEALVTRYLGALPAAGRVETGKDRGKREAMGKIEAEVASGIDPVGRVRLEWHGALTDNSWERRNKLFALGSVLQTRLREELREELGGVYGVGVVANEEYAPIDRYVVRVEFGCDPARIDELVAATEKVVNELRTAGPPQAVVDQVKEGNRRSREESLRTNGFWTSSFAGALQRGADPAAILTWDQRNDALSVPVLRDAAKEWLVDANRVQVVLVPAAPTAP